MNYFWNVSSLRHVWIMLLSKKKMTAMEADVNYHSAVDNFMQSRQKTESHLVLLNAPWSDRCSRFSVMKFQYNLMLEIRSNIIHRKSSQSEVIA